MKKPEPAEAWPESWKQSYSYDLLEIYGSRKDPGYANAYEGRKNRAIDYVLKSTSRGGKIVDLAAAQGNFSLVLAEMGYDVTWNDLREELVDYVRLKQEKGTLHYVPGNVFILPFREEFDVVLLHELIEHVAHPDALLKKAASFLKKGGHIILSTPNGDYCRSRLPTYRLGMNTQQYEPLQFKPNADGHLFLFNKKGIETLAQEAGLEVLEASLVNNILTCGHMKTRFLLKFLPSFIIHAIEHITQKLPFFIKRKIDAAWVVLLRKPE